MKRENLLFVNVKILIAVNSLIILSEPVMLVNLKSLHKIFWETSDKTRNLGYCETNKLWASYTGK